MSPDWTGSPQHVLAGVVLALVSYVAARRRVPPLWSVAVALIVTMAAEAMVELVEYPILYGDSATAQNYYDTIADIGATFVGAIVGAFAGLVGRR